MNWIVYTGEIILGTLCLIGLIAGVIAWVRRGFAVPRVVHVTARILVLVGVGVTAALLASGIRSLSFSVFMILGFPAWAYVGWFICGCPPEDQKRKDGYDIAQALTHDKK